MGNLYDGAFRTLLNDCRQHWLIKFLMSIIRAMNLSSFIPTNTLPICKMHRICVRLQIQVLPFWNQKRKTIIWNVKVGIRTEKLLSDCQIALDRENVTKETLTIIFPHTAVLYLRSKKTIPDQMRYMIHTPGRTVEYDFFSF